jgi:5-methyltetrahydrofolate--homocysteine methyltransferase
MGTCIQQYPLTADDFLGKEGCNELLVKSRPEIIQEIHARYFEAGADVVETNSFGSTGIVLAEYDIADQAYELNVAAAKIAREVAHSYSTKDRPRYVAGSIGPTTKLPSLGHVDFDTLCANYEIQARGLVDGGADILLVETSQDLLQAKAALAAIQQLSRQLGRHVPTMVQVTIETTGTMLVGSDIATVVTALQPYEIDAIGMNCATGPREMSDHIRYLSQNSPFYISCLPNAGIPENVGGKAMYRLTPDGLADHLSRFVKDLGVSIVGGCCGTTPDHIRAVAQAVTNLTPKPRDRRNAYQFSLSSLYSSVAMKIDPAPVIVGERTNANGSKKFRDLLAADDYDGLLDIARGQVREGAHLLDVCTAYVGRNEVKDMVETIERFNGQVDVPLMIDSTEAPVIEAALKRIAGKAIVNSINLEDGEERIEKIVPMCKRYGAAVVALTIDEAGMAKTAEKKFEIAQRIYDLCVNQYGMAPEDIVFDPLTFTLGSGDEEFRRAGVETIEAIRLIHQHLPGCGTILGVSNISFGLSSSARHVLNSVFLHYAIEAGLTMAILNSKHILPLAMISETERELCRRLVFDERGDDPEDPQSDPLMALIQYYENNAASTGSKKRTVVMPDTVEERLKHRIIHGEKTGLEADLDDALTTYPALEIINTLLLDGMKTVGELFGKGEMQLPFVLQSAEVMKKAVAYLEPHMEKAAGEDGERQAKATVVLATVKGDVHDIGKNLVDIILTNNGYKVVNIGIKQPIEAILQAAEQHNADAIGLSGLLVKSTAIMKENLAIMEERGLKTPVFLGGAALTPRFVEEDCQGEYSSRVFYCRDAFASLHVLEEVVAAKEEGRLAEFLKRPEPKKVEAPVLAGVNAMGGGAVAEASSPTMTGSSESKPKTSDVDRHVPRPTPPFWGTRVVEDVALEKIYPFLDERVIFSGHWQFRKGNKSQEEYNQYIEEKVRPILDTLKRRAKEERLLTPKLIYGYFPCQSEGDALHLYDPEDHSRRLHTFEFPRGGQKHLCLSDYFASVASGQMDVLPLHLVTMGEAPSAYAKTLFEAGEYSEYYFFHGFAVQMAEALAEYWHKVIREELDIAGKDHPDPAKLLLPSNYQGCRYSFGYPACPNLEDQVPMMALLRPERIGVQLTESYLLEPEQSTSALVVHHPQAYYFDVR